MPVLSVIVPAYAAERHLHRALEPLTGAGPDVEVVVVDDGSLDGTAAIADEYARRRPERFRVVRQQNRGHGGAITAGLAAARGTYVRVLDADDWLDPAALRLLVQTLARLEADGGVDAVFTDYVRERAGRRNLVSRFDAVFPVGRVFGWEDTARFGRRHVLMMHAITYRADVVRASGLRLPEHTYYVDNLVVVVPLVRVRRMAYLPEPLYHYVVGRPDQSIAADVMLRRVDQQIAVNRLVLHALPAHADVAAGVVPAQLMSALAHYVEAVSAVTSATLARGGTPEHLAKRDAFWAEIRAESPWMHTRLRRSLLGTSSNLPGQAGRRVTSLAYHVASRVVGFS